MKFRAGIRLDFDIEVTTVDRQELLRLQDSIVNAIDKHDTAVLSIAGFGQDVVIRKVTAFREVDGDPVTWEKNPARVAEDELERLMSMEDMRPPFDYNSVLPYHYDRTTQQYTDYKGNTYTAEEVRRGAPEGSFYRTR